MIGKQSTEAPHTEVNQHLIINEGFFFSSSAFSLGLSLCSISLFLSPQPQAPFPSVKVMEFFNGTCVKHGAAVHARPLSTEVWMLILEPDYK